MLIKTPLSEKNFEEYAPWMKDSRELEVSVRTLAGKKVVHINSTPHGGGVAEILQSLVPLQRSLGIDAEWYCLPPDAAFFAITKKIHNALQGSAVALTQEEQAYYLAVNKRITTMIEELHADIVVIHDLQPLAVKLFAPHMRAAARIYIDTSTPNPAVLSFLEPSFLSYEKLLFISSEYVPPFVPAEKIIISPLAIDPLAQKNISLTKQEAREILAKAGIGPDATIVSQVARFDPWKDQAGTIEAYRLVREKLHNPILVFAGIIEASDDPEAYDMVRTIEQEARGEKDIMLIKDTRQLGGTPISLFINALQQESLAVVQKSTREGFGLAITEAMWKGQPVIGGSAVGIQLQIENGVNGFVADSPAEVAARIEELYKNPALKSEMGQRARATVEEKFLITRYLEEELDMMRSLL